LGSKVMGKVTVQINGHGYEFTCDDGQEPHLLEMAELVSRRVRDLASSIGQVGETRLLVMTALLLADELADAYRQAEGREEAAAAESEAALAAVAARLERLAARLQRA